MQKEIFKGLLALFWCASLGVQAQEPSVVHGEINYYPDFESDIVESRPLAVWTPPGYQPGTEYPVIFMYDGQMLFDASTTWNKKAWDVDDVFGQAIIDSILPPALVVGLWNISEIRYQEYFPEGAFDNIPTEISDEIRNVGMNGEWPLSDDYLEYVVDEILPFVEENFSVNPSQFYIMGSSMGGLMSMYALCEYPETFQAAACVSPHFLGVFSYIPEVTGGFVEYMKERLPETTDSTRIYMDYGDQTLDSLYAPAQARVDSLMIELGWPSARWTTEFFPGAAHDEVSWKARLMTPLTFLLKPE
ncbi:prolyl oligopeptidase family serine peptidase [Cryomorphaceae bacterium]|nr:prolyl oligopeptidase family serine peptidase [Cryomorphaceae bacterium]